MTKILRRLDREFSSGLKLHLVMDNYGTHTEPHLQRWLKWHPRFICRFVPTRSSWLNLVESWFQESTDRTAGRGNFLSIPDLQRSIDEFLAAWNGTPKPVTWTVTVEQVACARAKMEQPTPGSRLPKGRTRSM